MLTAAQWKHVGVDWAAADDDVFAVGWPVISETRRRRSGRLGSGGRGFCAGASPFPLSVLPASGPQDRRGLLLSAALSAVGGALLRLDEVQVDDLGIALRPLQTADQPRQIFNSPSCSAACSETASAEAKS